MRSCRGSSDAGVVAFFEESINDAGRSERAFQPTISPGLRAAVVNEENCRSLSGGGAHWPEPKSR
jgi:hypothetical protein